VDACAALSRACGTAVANSFPSRIWKRFGLRQHENPESLLAKQVFDVQAVHTRNGDSDRHNQILKALQDPSYI
jgi:hypothetical protein